MIDLTPNQIMTGMAEKNRQLSMKNTELGELSEKKAAAERDYNIAFAKEIMNLKLEDEKVTLIQNLAKGDKTVAELKCKADIADGVYRACTEKIRDIRTSIDTYRSILSFLKEELQRSGIKPE